MVEPQLTLDEAIRTLRRDPAFADLVRDAYLERDVADSIRRFAASGEFAEVLKLIGNDVVGATVVDVGAGVGIASAAFKAAGAGQVIAIEPDESDEVGRGAMVRAEVDAEIVGGEGEDLPLRDRSADIVYARQVLHHARDLERFVAEVARVLRPGGWLIACREHVVDDADQLRAFLASHPVHRLAGGENAFSLQRYLSAISDAGLVLVDVLGPWDSVINAFPIVRSTEELEGLPVERLARKFGTLGRLAGRVALVRRLVWWRLDRREPGRLYSFVARQP